MAQEEPSSTDPKQRAITHWLEFAESTDYTARHLIDLALRTAAKLATRESTDALLEAASSEDEDVTILRRLRLQNESANADAEVAKARVESLERQIGHLRWLKSTAGKFEKDLTLTLAKAKKLATENNTESSSKQPPPPK